MSKVITKLSEFFDGKELYTPEIENRPRVKIHRLDIIYPKYFYVEEKEKRIYGYNNFGRPHEPKRLKIKVINVNYFDEIAEKLDRIRKICAASVALTPVEDIMRHNFAVIDIGDIIYSGNDEALFVKMLHENMEYVHAMANGVFCLNVLDSPWHTVEFEYLTYEFKENVG